jgi:hypothetical protein
LSSLNPASDISKRDVFGFGATPYELATSSDRPDGVNFGRYCG